MALIINAGLFVFYFRINMQRKGKEEVNSDYLYDRNKSFMEKWKEHVKVKKEEGGRNTKLEVIF